MARKEDQGLFLGQALQIGHDQAVLHPVLADSPGLPVGDQFVGVEGHVKVQVIVNHDLEGLAFHTVSLVLVDGLAVKTAGGPVAEAVDLAVVFQLFEKFRSHLVMMLQGDVAEGIFKGCGFFLTGKPGFTLGRPSDTRLKEGVGRQRAIEGWGVERCLGFSVHGCLLSYQPSL